MKESKRPFNNQFATLKLREEIIDEMSVTGGGEATLPRWTGPKKKSVKETIKKVGDKYAVFPEKGGKRLGTHDTKKQAQKQLAAIEISKSKKNESRIPADWKSAPSIPNRPSTGGYQYKQLWEDTEFEEGQQVKIQKKGSPKDGQIGKIVSITKPGAYNVDFKGTIMTFQESDFILSKDKEEKPESGEESEDETMKENTSYRDDIRWLLSDIQSHVETSSVLPTEFKEFFLDEWEQYVMGLTFQRDPSTGDTSDRAVRNRYLKAYDELEEYEEELKYALKRSGGEYEEVYEPMFEELRAYFEEEIGPRSQGNLPEGTKAPSRISEPDSDTVSLMENYSKFRKETKTRTNEQQLHAAMKLAEKKIHEANRILEYTSQLREELTETRVNKNTEKIMEKITRGIAEAYGKMKKLK